METTAENYYRAKSLLHELANTTRTISSELVKAIDFIQPSPAEVKTYSMPNLASAVREPARLLSISLDKFLTDIEPDLDNRNISRPTYDELLQNNVALELLLSRYSVYSHIQVYDIATSVDKCCQLLSGNSGAKYNRERFREIVGRATDIRRTSIIYGIHNSAQILSHIQDRISEQLQQMHSAQIERKLSTVNLGKLLLNAKRAFERRASIHRIAFNTEAVASDVILRNIDRERMEKCVSQLLDNAIKYMGLLPNYDIYETTWITLRAHTSEKEAEIQVESWGTPITREEYAAQLMFAEGYRGVFARQASAEGTGIGLADVKSYIASIGGKVKYDTIPVRKGTVDIRPAKTTLVISIPIKAPAKETDL